MSTQPEHECVSRTNGVAEHGAPEALAEAQAGKAAAMLLFNLGVADLAATQAAFDRHPDWEAA